MYDEKRRKNKPNIQQKNRKIRDARFVKKKSRDAWEKSNVLQVQAIIRDFFPSSAVEKYKKSAEYAAHMKCTQCRFVTVTD